MGSLTHDNIKQCGNQQCDENNGLSFATSPNFAMVHVVNMLNTKVYSIFWYILKKKIYR